jgi:hypothetical protein
MKKGKVLIGSLLGIMLLVGASVASEAHHGKGHRGLGIFQGKHRGGHHHGKHTGDRYRRGGDLSNLYEITGADSVQRTKMKPFIDEASKKIETLRSGYHEQEAKVFESLKTQLKPILKEDQLKKLEESKGNRNK